MHSQPFVVVLGFLAFAIAGCDLLGPDGDYFNDVPPEHVVALTAVYDETVEGSSRPIHRLVVADLEDPSNYKVLPKAGQHVGRLCFAPDKRRILYEDFEDALTGTRAKIRLYDLEKDEVIDPENLPAGLLRHCHWRADGSGFYYNASGPAGIKYSTYFDLIEQRAYSFAQSSTGSTIQVFGSIGQDTVLVVSNDEELTGTDISDYYYVDAQTGSYLGEIENEHLEFVPWEDEERGGWKRAAYSPDFNEEPRRIALLHENEEIRRLATAGLREGLQTYTDGEYLEKEPTFAGSDRILFIRHRRTSDPWQDYRVMILDTETGSVEHLVEPETIDGAAGLRAADY